MTSNWGKKAAFILSKIKSRSNCVELFIIRSVQYTTQQTSEAQTTF